MEPPNFEYWFYPQPRIRATISCFYMMTQTSLSVTWANAKAQRDHSAPQSRLRGDSILQGHRFTLSLEAHYCLPRRTKGLRAVATPPTQQTATTPLPLCKFLIANLELEFKLSAIRINDLKFSNRKFSTIFYNAQPPSHLVSLVTSRLSLAVAFLIETPRLEITVSSTLSAASNFLIETKRGVCIPDSLPGGVAFSLNSTPKTRIQCGREGDSA
jgi:hypothetical protein